jgi:hypothetical protein
MPHIMTPAEFWVLWLEEKVEIQNAHGDGLDWGLAFLLPTRKQSRQEHQ